MGVCVGTRAVAAGVWASGFAKRQQETHFLTMVRSVIGVALLSLRSLLFWIGLTRGFDGGSTISAISRLRGSLLQRCFNYDVFRCCFRTGLPRATMAAFSSALWLLLSLPAARSQSKVEGFFTDPNHSTPRKGCGGSTCLSLEGTRMISTDETGRLFVIGADNDGIVWTLLGELNDEASGHLTVDFSLKAPKVGDLSGKWTGRQVEWQDGNAWTRVTEAPRMKLDPKSDIQFDGLYVDPKIWTGGLAGLRMVSHRTGKIDGLSITVVGTDDGESFFNLAGAFRPTGREPTGHLHSFFLNMKPIGGPKKLDGIQIKGALLWPDGSQWTKVRGAALKETDEF